MIGLNQGLVANAAGAVRRRQGLRPRPRGRHRGIDEFLEIKYIAMAM